MQIKIKKLKQYNFLNYNKSRYWRAPMIKIVEAKTKKQMKDFATFPLKLYKGNKCYVPSIVEDEMVIQDGTKNFAKGNSECRCFLAYKDNKLAGRICAVIAHESNKKFSEKAIRFNRIDFIEDIEVLKALLNEVVKWGQEKGLNKIHGPWGFNDTDREGMLTYGFDKLSNYATNYSYPYYVKFMDELGFEKESEWIEFEFDIEHTDPRFYAVAEQLRQQGYRELTETMTVGQIVREYGDKFFDCYNKAYAALDNFIPIEGEAKKTTLSQFATLINRKFFSVVVDKMDQVVAFGVGLPHIGKALRLGKGRIALSAIPILYSCKRPHAIELALIGVDPLYRNYGIHAMVVDRFIQNFKKYKVKNIWMDPVLTTNSKMLQTWKGMEKTIRQKRQTYVMNELKLF